MLHQFSNHCAFKKLRRYLLTIQQVLSRCLWLPGGDCLNAGGVFGNAPAEVTLDQEQATAFAEVSKPRKHSLHLTKKRLFLIGPGRACKMRSLVGLWLGSSRVGVGLGLGSGLAQALFCGLWLFAALAWFEGWGPGLQAQHKNQARTGLGFWFT
jgi:hypothetical protein